MDVLSTKLICSKQKKGLEPRKINMLKKEVKRTCEDEDDFSIEKF